MASKKQSARPAGAKTRPAGQTDLGRIDTTTDAEIAQQIAEDPDTAPELDDDTWAAMVVERDRKQAISLRVDPDVLAWYRAQGTGYQSRMNAVLRAYMEHQRRAAG